MVAEVAAAPVEIYGLKSRLYSEETDALVFSSRESDFRNLLEYARVIETGMRSQNAAQFATTESNRFAAEVARLDAEYGRRGVESQEYAEAQTGAKAELAQLHTLRDQMPGRFSVGSYLLNLIFGIDERRIVRTNIGLSLTRLAEYALKMNQSLASSEYAAN